MPVSGSRITPIADPIWLLSLMWCVRSSRIPHARPWKSRGVPCWCDPATTGKIRGLTPYLLGPQAHHTAMLSRMNRSRSNNLPTGRGRMTRLRALSGIIAGAAILGATLAAARSADEQHIELLKPGVLTVAVTRDKFTDEYDSQLWIRRYVEQFAAEHELAISWIIVPFNESWLLAGGDEVDLVATNVASFPDRVSAGATFSSPFLYERRALRIHPDDEGQYNHINDFIGKNRRSGTRHGG